MTFQVMCSYNCDALNLIEILKPRYYKYPTIVRPNLKYICAETKSLELRRLKKKNNLKITQQINSKRSRNAHILNCIYKFNV